MAMHKSRFIFLLVEKQHTVFILTDFSFRLTMQQGSGIIISLSSRFELVSSKLKCSFNKDDVLTVSIK